MLTPEEIQSREFLVSLRGYDRDEVHAFLDEVAESFSTLLAEGAGEAATGRGADGATAAALEPAPVADAIVPEVVAPPVADVAPPTPVSPAPVSPFAVIGAETQRILEAAQTAGEEIVARAQTEATHAREEALAAAEAELAVLRDEAATTQRAIDVLELHQAEVADRLRQARDTADLALLEMEVQRTEEAADDDPTIDPATEG